LHDSIDKEVKKYNGENELVKYQRGCQIVELKDFKNKKQNSRLKYELRDYYSSLNNDNKII